MKNSKIVKMILIILILINIIFLKNFVATNKNNEKLFGSSIRSVTVTVDFILNQLNKNLFQSGIIYSNDKNDYNFVKVEILEAEKVIILLNNETKKWAKINPNFDMNLNYLEEYLIELRTYYTKNYTNLDREDLYKSEEVTKLNLNIRSLLGYEQSIGRREKPNNYIISDYKKIEQKCKDSLKELKQLDEK